MCNKLSHQDQIFEYRRQGELQILDISTLFERITLDINPNVKMLSISSKERIHKHFTSAVTPW